MNKNKLIIGIITTCIVGFTSCKKYLDVNKNPNVAQTATVQVLLPTGQMYVASSVGTDLEITGSIWGQYWTQNPNSSQYKSLEQYEPNNSTFEYPWDNLYLGVENLDQMYKLAVAQNKLQYQAIGLLMQAYTFQLITDGWGDVPYSQALQGLNNVPNPHYDAQKIIYSGILGMIDSAITLINPSDVTLPGTDDLIYSGNMTKWKKFAYTLKLKVLLRLSYIDPGTASAGIAAMPVAGSAYISDVGPAVLEATNSREDAQINFITTSGNKNPLYAEEVGLTGTQNLVGSNTCIDSMNANDDYRAYIFYQYLSNGSIAGVNQGNYNAVLGAGTYSIPSTYVAGDATDLGVQEGLYTISSARAPVKFLSCYESYFLQAEAVARGYLGGNDATLYRAGITASFDAYAYAFADENLELAAAADSMTSSNGNLITSDLFLTADYALYSYMNGDTIYGAPPAYWSQYPAGGSQTDKLRFILTQKWFSMCGNQGFEAWTEWRRTGYPDFFVKSANGVGGFPERLIYPNSEVTRNLNFPGLQSVQSKVWWDVH